MIKWFARFALLCALVFAVLPAFAQETQAPRVGVMTMRPGEIFWERFGHNAIVIEQPDGQRESYNFGFFDPTEPDFFSRFARGEMRYQLAVLPTSDDLSVYEHEGRGASIQWLNVTDAQARELASALALNASPEHKFYHYNYFTDNCSTRVRDAVDKVLGGEIKRQLLSRSNGSTYRSEAVRLADNATWMRILFDLGLGPKADKPMSIWEASFIPGTFQRALNDVRIQNVPLVKSEQKVLEHHLRPDAIDPIWNWWQWLIGGAVLGLLLYWIAKRAPTAFGIIATLSWQSFAILGGVLVYLWFFTVHDFAWRNQNLWLLNPLALACIWFYWRAPGSKFNARALQVSVTLVNLVLPLTGMFVYWLMMGRGQSNAHWIALLLPIHLGLFFGVRHLQWRNGNPANRTS